MRGPVHQLTLFGREEGWILPTCNQLEATKHFHSEGTLQEGRCQYDQGSSATIGLNVLPGPQRSIPDSSNCQKILQILLFSMGCQNIQIYLPPLWTLQYPMSLHETLIFSNSLLRARSLRCIIYLDDILAMHQFKEVLCREIESMFNLPETLGFTINYDKSQTIPAQQIQFFEFLVNSILIELLLPQGKV